jgi:dTDP-4-amino-4,6-dideoxygalactose transaminase
MKTIPFNSFLNLNYQNSLDELFSDYNNFRSKVFTKRCIEILQSDYPTSELFLTHSATGALEMIAMLIEIKSGDEVILPSFTFISTVNAFISRGAIPVFVDIHSNDLNVNPKLVEAAITPKTKAIIAVHYSGNACEMDQLMKIAEKNKIFLIEDAAMGFGCHYDNKSLGSIGHFGVISFDITKQITSVQGGLCLINDPQYVQRAHNIYHIGTNRMDFHHGLTPYYEWVDIGSKFQMNELAAVILFEQLKVRDKSQVQLISIYQRYLGVLGKIGLLEFLPMNNMNTDFKHSLFLLMNNYEQREKLKQIFYKNNIESFSHYEPLHLSKYYKSRFGDCKKSLPETEDLSSRILRLPFHQKIIPEDFLNVVGVNLIIGNDNTLK